MQLRQIASVKADGARPPHIPTPPSPTVRPRGNPPADHAAIVYAMAQLERVLGH